jgi:hypothetical protein
MTLASASFFNLLGKEGSVQITNSGFSYITQPSTNVAASRTVLIVGPLALVVVEVTSPSVQTIPYNFSLFADLYVDDYDAARCYRINDGFYAEGSHLGVYFLCKNRPLVVDASAYWFGSYGYRGSNYWSQVAVSSFTTDDSAMSISWQNRVIPAGGSDFFSILIRWGPEPRQPILTLSGLGSIPSFVLLDQVVSLTATISNSAGTSFSIYAVPDGAITRLLQVAGETATDSSATISFTAGGLGIEGGQHTITFYAIDSEGRVSVGSSFALTANIATSSPRPSYTPARSISASPSQSHTPSETRTPTETRSPTSTRTPSVSKSPFLARAVMGGSVAGFGDSFALSGNSGNVAITVSGFSVYRQGNSQFLTLTPRVKAVGPLALVGFEIVSSSAVQETYSIGFDAQFYVEGYSTSTCLDFGSAFSAEGYSRVVYFLCRDSPLVVDTTTYWFGLYLDRGQNQWSQGALSSYTGEAGMTLSWQNRPIAPGATDSVSVVVRWGPDAPTPILNLDGAPQSAVNLDTPISVTGFVSESSGETYWVQAVVDRNVARLIQIAPESLIGSPIVAAVTPQELGLQGGSHQVDFYAIDSEGGISAAVTWTVTINAPTPSAKRSPTQTRSPARSRAATLSRSFGPGPTPIPATLPQTATPPQTAPPPQSPRPESMFPVGYQPSAVDLAFEDCSMSEPVMNAVRQMECCAHHYSPLMCAGAVQNCSVQLSEQFKSSIPASDRDSITQTCNAFCSNVSPRPSWCSAYWVLGENDLAFAVCLGSDADANQAQCCGRYPNSVGCEIMPAACVGFGYPASAQTPGSIVAACDTYCGLASPRPGWCGAAGATRALPSPVASRSPPPRQTPRTVAVSEMTAMTSSWEPVVLAGSGVISPASGSVLDLLDVTIPAGEAIVAVSLRVGSYLELDGASALIAFPELSIDIVNNSVDIVLVAAAKSLPAVDLGLIGEDYTKLPKAISVTISADPFEKKDLGSFSHVLISGQTLSNCEQWKSLVKLSDPAHFEAVCEDGAVPGAKTLAGVRSLVVKGLKQEDGPNLILYIAAAAGVVVVIVVIVAIVVCCKKRRRRRRKNAGSEGSYSYSYSRSYSLPSGNK